MDKIEFPVILEQNNEVLTLLLDRESAVRATQDEQFLRSLVCRYQENAARQDNVESPVAGPSVVSSKGFTWPDVAVLLLIELYREKEYDFKSGQKRHNAIWRDIANQLQDTNYEVNGLLLKMNSSYEAWCVGIKKMLPDKIMLNLLLRDQVECPLPKGSRGLTWQCYY